MGTITTGVIECYDSDGSSVHYSVGLNYKGRSIRVQSCYYSGRTKHLPIGEIVEIECNDDEVDWSMGWNREVKILDGRIFSIFEVKGQNAFYIFLALCFILLFIYCSL